MLNLIFYMASPSDPFGYSVATKEICSRMIKDGHSVRVATRYMVGAPKVDLGIPVFTGVDAELVKFVSDTENVNYIFMVKNERQSFVNFTNWVACAAFDQEFIFPALVDNLKTSKFQFCVSQHNKLELERVGFNPHYCPWGVDTKKFYPDPELGKNFRKKYGWSEDIFVIGVVGQNLANDRKNLVNMIKAFQKFSLEHLDTILYLHTDIIGTMAMPLERLIRAAGLTDRVFWCEQKRYHMYAIPQEELPEMYNALDIFCLPSKGESFGFPLLEAQSCGIPVITTDTTSGSELMKSGWLIPVDDDDYEYLDFGTWNAVVRPSKICHQLEYAYTCWKANDIWRELKIKARERVMEYDWDSVYEIYWKPFLKVLEDNKK